MLLKHALQEYPNAEIAEVNCTSETTAEIIVSALKQHCLALNTAHGRTLRPSGDKRLVLFLSDLHLPRPDKYDTVEVVAFAQQLLNSHGFYDSDLEWTSVPDIQLVVTVVIGDIQLRSASGSGKDVKEDKLGEQLLSTRFLANIHIVGIPYPSPSSLQTVYQHMLIPVLSPLAQFTLKPQLLAAAMIHLFTHTQRTFTQAKHTHYVFTPRDLINWVIIFHIVTHRMMLMICKCCTHGHTRHCISSEADWKQ